MSCISSSSNSDGIFQPPEFRFSSTYLGGSSIDEFVNGSCVDLNNPAAAGVHGKVILGSMFSSLVHSFCQLKTRGDEIIIIVVSPLLFFSFLGKFKRS